MSEPLINASQLPSRRQLLLAAAGVAAAPTLTACSSSDTVQSVARALRQPGAQSAGTATSPLHDLVRQAILAPSSHNTQCWRFKLAGQSIAIAPDLTRHCPAVDPDNHQVFVSLGCAAENLVHAALAIGLQADPHFEPGGDGVIAVNLQATRARITSLFQAIAGRQCTRGDYDGKPVSPAELRQLEQAGTSDGVSVRL